MAKQAKVPFSADGKKAVILRIDDFRWVENDYRPETSVKLWHDGKALWIRLETKEREPMAKALEDDGKIWCDSCLESFVRPFPDDPRYLNLEANSLGNMILGIGAGRGDRKSIVKAYKPRIGMKAEKGPDSWSVSYHLPFDMLREIYGKSAGTPLKTIHANFYKCGDETPLPHFGMWSPITNGKIDYHQSEFFGTLELEDE